MRSSDDNPLDLNNFPEDFSRDANKQVFEASSSSSGGAHRKKKSGDKEGKDECGKVYECRFCSLKFCKSQALGGHMNRHRQERETETLNRARQLVFGNDTLAAASSLSHQHLGCPSVPGVYHSGGTNMGDTASLGFRSIYPSGRMFSGPNPSSLSSSPFHQQYAHTSHSPSRIVSITPQYHHHHRHNNTPNDYCIGHVLNASTSQHNPPQTLNNYGSIGGVNESNYTCIGAPIGPGLLPGRGGNDIAGVAGGREVGSGGHHHHHHRHRHHHHQDQEGMMMMNWERSYGGGTGTQQRIDPGSLNNRFQDGF